MKIKIITLNAWKQGNLQNKAVDFLNQEKPDIVFLQEIYNGEESQLELRYRSLNIFRSKLQLAYWQFGPQFRDITPKDQVNAEQGLLTLSTLPIVSFKNIYFDIQYTTLYNYEDKQDFSELPQNVLFAKINLDGTVLNVFNVHGPWNLNGTEDDRRRLAMSRIIVNEIKDKQNVIVAGDFNVRRPTQTIKQIEKYLSNIFADELKTTFNMKRKDNRGYAGAAVDMMFVSPNIKVIEHYCPQVDISDHLPLVAVLEV